MTNDDYEDTPQLCEIMSGILGRLAFNLVEGEFIVGGNVVDLAEYRARRNLEGAHARLARNSIPVESQAPAEIMAFR